MHVKNIATVLYIICLQCTHFEYSLTRAAEAGAKSMPFGKLKRPPVPERHCRWRTGSGAWPEQLSISPDAGWFDSHCALGFWEPLLSMHAGKMLPLRRCKCCPTRPQPDPDSQPVAALELGSWEGNSTAWIASHMCWHTDSVLVAVDDWSWANQFLLGAPAQAGVSTRSSHVTESFANLQRSG